MTTPLTIVARIEANKSNIEQAKEALLKLIEPTRKEDGCLQYDFHQDNESPEIFLFYEMWVSRELWQDHMNSEHLKRYIDEVAGIINTFTLNEMSKII